MHDWIIEGLPPQVLVHHKKMLGIYESDTEVEPSSSMGDTGGQIMQQPSMSQSRDQDSEQHFEQVHY